MSRAPPSNCLFLPELPGDLTDSVRASRPGRPCACFEIGWSGVRGGARRLLQSTATSFTAVGARPQPRRMHASVSAAAFYRPTDLAQVLERHFRGFTGFSTCRTRLDRNGKIVGFVEFEQTDDAVRARESMQGQSPFPGINWHIHYSNNTKGTPKRPRDEGAREPMPREQAQRQFAAPYEQYSEQRPPPPPPPPQPQGYPQHQMSGGGPVRAHTGDHAPSALVARAAAPPAPRGPAPLGGAPRQRRESNEVRAACHPRARALATPLHLDR